MVGYRSGWKGSMLVGFIVGDGKGLGKKAWVLGLVFWELVGWKRWELGF